MKGRKTMRKYITATFLDKKINDTFEKDFGSYTEFNNFLIVNRQYVLLRVKYAR